MRRVVLADLCQLPQGGDTVAWRTSPSQPPQSSVRLSIERTPTSSTSGVGGRKFLNIVVLVGEISLSQAQT